MNMNKEKQDEYFYKLVCIDESNPLEYTVLLEENVDTLDKVHELVEKHIHEYIPNMVKWMLIPFRKDSVVIGESA